MRWSGIRKREYIGLSSLSYCGRQNGGSGRIRRTGPRWSTAAPGGVISQYCFPQGMPMMMNLYDPMEVVITPEVTYILISHVNDSYRRIYTDGRG
jgi:hypothetical protein